MRIKRFSVSLSLMLFSFLGSLSPSGLNAEYINYLGAWSPGRNYSIGDTVTFQNKLYFSTSNSNLNRLPIAQPKYWTSLTGPNRSPGPLETQRIQGRISPAAPIKPQVKQGSAATSDQKGVTLISGLIIVDANGLEIGTTFDGELIHIKAGRDVITLGVGRSGFFDSSGLGGINYYLSSDCTGTTYTPVSGDLLTRAAPVIPPDPYIGGTFSSGEIYYPEPQNTVYPRSFSYKQYFPGNTYCQTYSDTNVTVTCTDLSQDWYCYHYLYSPSANAAFLTPITTFKTYTLPNYKIPFRLK